MYTPMKCVHRQESRDGYTVRYATTCGKKYALDRPIEVGLGGDARPTDNGPFCSHCGKQIVDLNKDDWWHLGRK